MSDFRRLRELHEDDDFGAAFRSADRDGPAHGADAKLLAALGVSAAAVAAAAATGTTAAAGAAGTTAAGAAGTAAAGGGSGLAAKVGGGSMLAKWLVGSAVIVSTSVVGTVLVQPSSTPAAAPSATVVATPHVVVPFRGKEEEKAPAEPTEEQPALAPEPIAEPSVTLPTRAAAPVVSLPRVRAEAPRAAPLEQAEPPALTAVDPNREEGRAPMVDLPSVGARSGPVRTDVQFPAPPQPPPDPSDLDEARSLLASARSLAPELSELEHVRSLLTAGRASDALVAVDTYRRAFPKGALMQESEVLRLDALVRLGQRVAVEREGRVFLELHPQSPQAPRVRTLLLRNASAPKQGK